jgi:serine/threonine protein kinase
MDIRTVGVIGVGTMLPFRGDTSGVIFDSILNRTPVSVVRLDPDTPPKLEEIVSKCLEKDRNLRYQRSSEIRTDLQRVRRDTESGKKLTDVLSSACGLSDSSSDRAMLRRGAR